MTLPGPGDARRAVNRWAADRRAADRWAVNPTLPRRIDEDLVRAAVLAAVLGVLV